MGGGGRTPPHVWPRPGRGVPSHAEDNKIATLSPPSPTWTGAPSSRIPLCRDMETTIRCGDRTWRPLSLALDLLPLFRDWGPTVEETGDPVDDSELEDE